MKNRDNRSVPKQAIYSKFIISVDVACKRLENHSILKYPDGHGLLCGTDVNWPSTIGPFGIPYNDSHYIQSPTYSDNI